MKKTAASRPFPFVLLESTLLSVAVTLLGLAALSGVCMATGDPGAYLTPCAYLALLPGALCAGIHCAKGARKTAVPLGGIPAGLLAGLSYGLLLFTLGLLLPAPAAPVPDAWKTTLIRSAAILLLSAAAGYTVTHKPPKSHRPKRR